MVTQLIRRCRAAVDTDVGTVFSLQNFPGGRSPVLSPPQTLITEALQYTESVLTYEPAPTGTLIPQPAGPILAAQEERMRQVSLSGGYLYSCKLRSSMLHLQAEPNDRSLASGNSLG